MFLALDMMMVDPAYQRQGAGRLLVQWGLARAKEMGVEVNFHPSFDSNYYKENTPD